MSFPPPPDVTPLDETRLLARQAHLESEIARTSPRPRGRRPRVVRAGIVAVAGVAVGAALLTGRGGGPDVVSRALAAVSRGPYLVVVTSGDGMGTATLVHLRTGSVERLRAEIETWYDTRRQRPTTTRFCVRMFGPQTRTGCFPGAMMGADSLAITGSIDGYRSALADGRATKTGSAVVRDGRRRGCASA